MTQKNNDIDVFEWVSEYLDNEVKDNNRLETIRMLIESDERFRNEYLVQKRVKEILKLKYKSERAPNRLQVMIKEQLRKPE